MIRRLLPLLLVAAATAQAADPASRYVSRQASRPTPTRQIAMPRTTQVERVVVTETVRQPVVLVPLPAGEGRLLEQANVLPLALSDEFAFRKQKITVYQKERRSEIADSPMARMERDRILYGAVNNEERDARQGYYFVFWWRSLRPANVTVRLEYRQGNLGNLVQAREFDYSVPKGTHQAKFSIIGDDFLDDGTVTAWRAVIIEDQKIVATRQSFLWH